MLSAMKRLLLLSLFAFALLISLPQSTSACSCLPRPTVLDEFDSSDEVIIVRAISVEKAEKSQQELYGYPDGIRSTTVVVERVFKGTLKIRDEIVLGQGSGSNCVWTFDEKSVGRQYLLYLNRPNGKSDNPESEPRMWYASECGRSRGLAGAAEDLLYLENLSRVRGKTRISGTLNSGWWFGPEVAVEGKRIKIVGPKKKYEVKTDKNGVFEIYDVPPGKYFLEVEPPAGWKVALSWLRYSSSVVRSETEFSLPEMRSSKQFAIKLEPKKHASVDIMFEIDNYVRGRVIGPKGKPMSGVCVYMLLPGKDWGPSGCTDEQGRFEISSVPEGEWILGANQDDNPSARQPFRAIFYPGVRDRERATVISIGAGQVIENIDLVIPKLEETITVKGMLQYSDGQPVADKSVEFKVTKKNEKADGDATTRTDEAGRFTLTILKGLTGEIAGDHWVFEGYYKNCPKVDELIAQSGRNGLPVRSNVVTLTTAENIFDLELTFPFPRCEKAKE